MSGPALGDSVRVIKNDLFADDISQTLVGQRGTIVCMPGLGSRVYEVLFEDSRRVSCYLHELAPARKAVTGLDQHHSKILKLQQIAATVARLTRELALAQAELDEQRLVVAKALEVSP